MNSEFRSTRRQETRYTESRQTKRYVTRQPGGHGWMEGWREGKAGQTLFHLLGSFISFPLEQWSSTHGDTIDLRGSRRVTGEKEVRSCQVILISLLKFPLQACAAERRFNEGRTAYTALAPWGHGTEHFLVPSDLVAVMISLRGVRFELSVIQESKS